MPLRPNMEQSDYLDIFRRRKWVFVFSVLIVFFAATVYCVLATDQYRSTVKIRIIPPAVPEGMVRSNVNVSTDDRLLIIRQDILSKNRLLGLVNDIGIPTLGFDGMSPDAMVQTMRERISVGEDKNPKKKQKNESKTPLDPNIFMLSFYHPNPDVARQVVSRLASILVGENIRSREAVSRGTTEFLKSEVEETRNRLEQQEEKLKRYKIQFGGELPQQEASNLNRLTRLQEQIKGNSDAVARLGDRKILLESQIRTAANIAKEGLSSGEKGDSYDLEESLLAELDVRRKKLEELQNKYTLLHPAAVQARNDIAQLETRIANLRRAAKSGGNTPGAPAVSPSGKPSATGIQREVFESREVRTLREQISAIDLEIAALKRENASASRTIDQVQRQMERLPQREQELVSLTRDYENIKASYDGLLKKQLESRISEKLEEKQKGELFQIMEPATLPTAPFTPKRLMVLALALMASLVIGAGGSIGLEMMDPTLRGSKEFKSFFDIPILACLPVIEDGRSMNRGGVRRGAVAGGMVLILGAYLIFLTLNAGRILSILQSGLFSQL